VQQEFIWLVAAVIATVLLFSGSAGDGRVEWDEADPTYSVEAARRGG